MDKVKALMRGTLLAGSHWRRRALQAAPEEMLQWVLDLRNEIKPDEFDAAPWKVGERARFPGSKCDLYGDHTDERLVAVYKYPATSPEEVSDEWPQLQEGDFVLLLTEESGRFCEPAAVGYRQVYTTRRNLRFLLGSTWSQAETAEQEDRALIARANAALSVLEQLGKHLIRDALHGKWRILRVRYSSLFDYSADGYSVSDGQPVNYSVGRRDVKEIAEAAEAASKE